MEYSIQEQIQILLHECIRFRKYIILAFVFICVLALSVGLVWPKKFSSSSIIYVDTKSSIQPLLRGRIVETDDLDVTRNAREIILGSIILDAVVEAGGWLTKDQGISPRMKENIINGIKSRTEIASVKKGSNLIKITYTDVNSRRAYLVVKSMSEQFVDLGKSKKIEESRSAYTFIEKQVDVYLTKLTDVDSDMKDFLVKNPDAQPGTLANVTSKVEQLKNKLEETRLLIQETEIKKQSIQKQLSGEAASTMSQSIEGKYRKKREELQEQMENLLLTYTPTYPDVIRLKRQVSALELAIKNELEQREMSVNKAEKAGDTYLDQSIATNPVYQSLRSGLSDTETLSDTLNTRFDVLDARLTSEYERMKRIQNADAMMQTLMRDYSVNQEIYKDLLKRRENARVSRSMESFQSVTTFTILEPASQSLSASGLRFIHFTILGLLGGILAPIVLIYLVLQADNKIRTARYIKESLNINILAVIPHYGSFTEEKSLRRSYMVFGFVFVLMVAMFVSVGLLK